MLQTGGKWHSFLVKEIKSLGSTESFDKRIGYSLYFQVLKQHCGKTAEADCWVWEELLSPG